MQADGGLFVYFYLNPKFQIRHSSFNLLWRSYIEFIVLAYFFFWLFLFHALLQLHWSLAPSIFFSCFWNRTNLKNAIVKEGQPGHLECRLIPIGDPSMKVEWFFNGKPIDIAHRFRYVLNLYSSLIHCQISKRIKV